MKFLDYSINSGLQNMQIDEDLLNSAISKNEKEHIFRLYGWEPSCISLGKNQNDNFLNSEALNKYNIDVVRRMTGGRALLHANELTYSYIAPTNSIPNGESIIESYKFISNIWINIFQKLGIYLTIGGAPTHITQANYCMSISTGADLCYQNKKFIGSAQCRKKGYILQHGSILIDYDKNLLDEIFQETTNFSNIISLKEINPKLTINDLIKIVKSSIHD